MFSADPLAAAQAVQWRSLVARRFAMHLFGALTFSVGSITMTAQQGPATNAGAVHGVVHDPLGGLVAGAAVTLMHGDRLITTTVSGPEGKFVLPIGTAGRYSLRVTAPGFALTTTPQSYFRGVSDSDSKVEADITLASATLTQQVTVTATGTPTPEAQTGADVNVIPAAEFRYMPEVQDSLRLVPGLQVTQTGQMGGTTGLSIRGGDTDANKVLVDGLSANQIGGAVEFANIAAVGIDSVEVLNEPDSVLYGADALAGVVHLTTRRAASTSLPLFTYAGDAGNFHTYRNDATASAVYRGFDLFSEFGRMQTSNDIPNSEFHDGTYAGNFGWTPDARNDLRFIIRHADVAGGQPNAIDLYGIPDDAQQKERDLYLSGTWNGQVTPRWHNVLRYGYVRLNGQYREFAATGILDPATGYCDGAPVTIRGANGYAVSGQALFQYSNGAPPYLEHNRDSSVYAQSDFRVNSHLLLLGAFRFASEEGSAFYQGATASPIRRGNYDGSIEFSGDLKNRLFYTAGTGLENNGLFGFAGTPRVSLAYYLARPSNRGFFTGTKLHGTFGKGIKEPSVYQQQLSLFGQISNAQAAQLNVGALGPENSRTFDGGVDQQFFNARVRGGVTWFHNEFTNRIEYVPQNELILLGVPGATQSPVAANGGAYVNSSAFRSEGLEATAEMQLTRALFARAGYTYTDAVVQHSFSSDNLVPAYNTASNFSTVQIGVFSPLVGARPFRVAPHSGFFALSYARSKWYGSLTGTLVGHRDDSDFLLDSNFGNSLLLPNQNLLGSYQRVELGGGYQVTPRINVYSEIRNLLSEHYYEAFGYPALPLTFRSGIKFEFGGESWKLR